MILNIIIIIRQPINGFQFHQFLLLLGHILTEFKYRIKRKLFHWNLSIFSDIFLSPMLYLHKQFSQVSFLKWALYFNHNGGINNNLGRKYSQIQIYFLSSVCIGAYLHNISTAISRQITDWMIFYVFSYLLFIYVFCCMFSLFSSNNSYQIQLRIISAVWSYFINITHTLLLFLVYLPGSRPGGSQSNTTRHSLLNLTCWQIQTSTSGQFSVQLRRFYFDPEDSPSVLPGPGISPGL